MTYSRIYSDIIQSQDIVEEIKKGIRTIYSLSTEEYNLRLFRDIAVGFKSIVWNMEENTPNAFPLLLKWLKLYVRIQHKISHDDETLLKKFEEKVPVCTSYIAASLQYQTKIAHYHQEVMSMCLSLFDSISLETMKQIAYMKTDIIALLWMPIEFVGDYNTQKLSVKLIVKILQCVSNSEQQRLIVQIETVEYVRNAVIGIALDFRNFNQLCRQLLNKFNMEVTQNCAVFSVYCKTALFGSVELFKPQNMDNFWIDFNYTSHTVSLYCQLRQNNNPEELFIRIRIEKLKIDNEFNCIVSSPEPAIFTGTEVPAELINARIAVFTLPRSEIERLKANKDLLGFFSKFQNDTNSDSDVPPTPNTIDKYLGEDSQMEEDLLDQVLQDNSNLLQAASQLQLSLGNISIEKAVSEETPNDNDLKKDNPSTKTVVKPNVITNKVLPSESSSCKPYLSLPNVVASMESGYNTAVSTDKKDLSVFKKPNKPISQPVTSKAKSHKPDVSTAKRNSTIFKNPTTPLRQKKMQHQPPEQLSKSIQSIESPTTQPADQQRTNRGTTKANAPKAAVTPLVKKTKRAYRKKPSTNTGISPKRKRVNTIKPLNHLIQPDCDPVEANLEYVENGGYFNIIRFIKSKAGTTCFNEQQREQILKNIKTIYENIERATQRSNQKADPTSDSDSNSIILQKTRRRKRKALQNIAADVNFVPYTQWKTKQKEKTDIESKAELSSKTKGANKQPAVKNRASSMAPKPLNNSESSVMSQPASKKTKLSLNECTKLNKSESETSAKALPIPNLFDQLKTVESNRPSCSKLKKTSTIELVVARNNSPVSSVSSCSNHNFRIVESDNDQISESSSDKESTIVDIVRAVPKHKELSPPSCPLALSQTKASNHLHDSSAFEVSWTEHLQKIADTSQNYSQTSEIYEYLDEYPPTDPIMPPEMFADNSISVHESQLQGMSIHSSSSSQEAAINCSQVTPQMSHTSTRPDVPIRSQRNRDSADTWLIDKYLREQRPQLQSPTCFDISPEPLVDLPDSQLHIGQDLPTGQPQNFTIIQNQFIMSTNRKSKTLTANEEYPLSKIPSIGECVPLKGYPKLLSSFVERLNNEKDRLMKHFQISQEDVFESTRQIVDEVLKSIADHEAAINATQEELSSVYGKLEWLIENQQKNKHQLENIYLKLIGRIKASVQKREDIDQAYQAAAEQLKNYATTSTNELWKNFANLVIGSVQDRLKRLVEM